jgi:polyisoprenoid-binding protein YceI
MKKLSLIVAALGFFAAAAHAEPATYALDPSHSFASWEIPHFGTSTNRGRFNKTTGTVTIDKVAKTGSLDVTVDTTSLDTGTAAFTKHISSDEMLNVALFPSSHLVANKFVFNGDKVAEIDGNLTLLGKTNPVVLKATNYNCYMSPMVKREVCGGDFEMMITRSQFGVSYGLNYGFPDTMKVTIQVEGVKQ